MRTGRIPAPPLPPPAPEDDNRLTTMKKYLLLLLLGTFLCACSSDDGEGIPFVTDVVMPSEARTFAPGDEVTVSAKGFEAGDDIMLRIAWPLTNAAISEGYADGVWGVVTSRTESSITFLAPGGYPAGTAEVKLFRRGRAMPLGRISVSDGTPPASYTLYGVRNDDTGEVAISEFDMQTAKHHYRRELRRNRESRISATHKRDKLVVYQLYNLLSRSKTVKNSFADGFFADVCDKALHHAEIDVRFQKRNANFAHSLLYFELAQLSARLDFTENMVQFFT